MRTKRSIKETKVTESNERREVMETNERHHAEWTVNK